MAALRLGLDARLLGAGRAGLGRYTEELLTALTRYGSNLEIVAFTDGSSESHAIVERFGIESHAAPYPPYSVAEQLKFPRMLSAARLDLVHFPHFNVPLGYREPYLVTIHDLILHYFPSRQASTRRALAYWIKYAAFRLAFRRVIVRAKRIIAVSNFTAEDLLTYYPWLCDRLRIVPEPIPSFTKFSTPDKGEKLPYTVRSPYVLVVGNFYPHKNIRTLLEAWVSVHRETGCQLVLVGRDDTFAAELKRYTQALFTSADEGAVAWLGLVTDGQLTVLYRRAAYCLCPSLYEGVGLPGMEALALGTPTLSSPAAALPEIYGQSVTYVPIGRAQSLAAALILTLRSPRPRTETKLDERISSRRLALTLQSLYAEIHSDHHMLSR